MVHETSLSAGMILCSVGGVKCQNVVTNILNGSRFVYFGIQSLNDGYYKLILYLNAVHCNFLLCVKEVKG